MQDDGCIEDDKEGDYDDDDQELDDDFDCHEDGGCKRSTKKRAFEKSRGDTKAPL